MADTKLPALTALTAPSLTDLIYGVDVSDTTDDASGSSRSMQLLTMMQYMPHGLTEISITGATTATVGRAHVCSGTTADYTVALPSATGNEGKHISARMASGLTKLVTVGTSVMQANESVILFSDGTSWIRLGGVNVPMRCKMSRMSTQNFNNASFDKCLLNTTNFAEGIIADPTTNNRATIVRDGLYLCKVFSRFDNASEFQTVAGFLVNNSEVFRAEDYSYADSVCATSEVVSLSAGDYCELKLYQNSSVTLDVYASSIAPYISILELPSR